MNQKGWNEGKLGRSLLGVVAVAIFSLLLMVVPVLAQEGTQECP